MPRNRITFSHLSFACLFRLWGMVWCQTVKKVNRNLAPSVLENHLVQDVFFNLRRMPLLNFFNENNSSVWWWVVAPVSSTILHHLADFHTHTGPPFWVEVLIERGTVFAPPPLYTHWYQASLNKFAYSPHFFQLFCVFLREIRTLREIIVSISTLASNWERYRETRRNQIEKH